MARVQLTRLVEFEASHRIRRSDKTEAENQAAFGKAAADHAHRYQVGVTIRGPLQAAAGGIVNLGLVDRVLKEEITDRLDGRHINEVLPEFAEGRRLATGEALAVYFWERVAPRLPPGVTLHAVRVQESPHLYSEYFGEA
jgi:6-pyruvoyltetrahydropterin/6-carboxytetrahydropterin synthase